MWKRLRSDKGQEVVEFAIILPLLFLLLFGIIDFGIIIFSYDTIANATREGARYGIVHPTDDAGIEAAARRLTSGLSSGALQINITRPGGNTIRVEAIYDVSLITGFVMEIAGGNPTLRLNSVSTMQIE
ncbi:MAG: pilus assembly protein [Anaerolineae bacterium]|nr:pilus assembly protein [Anaerolineae bacterium]